MSEIVLQVRKGKLNSIIRKHPWVFSGALWDGQVFPDDGSIVSIQDSKGNFLAKGHFQNATIAVRILSFRDEPIDESFFTKRISNAIDLRKKLGLFSDTNSICRLVHGEGDALPGLVIDFYNGVAIIQCHSLGMYLSLELIKNSLLLILGSKLIIYNKSSDTLPRRIDITDSFLHGNSLIPHQALENEIHYEIDWINGQKTGFFIDQRENRALLGRYAAGKNVLNTFCYSGGFSLAALKGGAKLVHSLDSSRRAIELTEQNILLNQFAGIHETIHEDAMEYLKNLRQDYDIIVLDPPAFAKHRDKRHQAIQGYKRLNANAIRQIKPGGFIFTFSCSQVVDKQIFNNTVIAAAIETGRSVRIIEQLHQPADHPVNAFHPEGEYLKGLVIQVD